MKRIILLAGILFFFCHIQAQEVSRGQLMDLFYKAQKAVQANNTQEALEIYKTILSVDANLSTPYLKMADIYVADEGNEASMAAAAALYRKYLSLQPDDENAAAITQKIAILQQKTSNEADLNQLLYIGKEDVQNVFATKARAWLKARNTEELAQQINAVDSLSDKALTQIDEGNTQESIQNLQQLTEQVDPTNPYYMQANMQLADIYNKQGNMEKMQETLASSEENMNINQNLSQYPDTKINDDTPFGEDICGVWVSDLAYKDFTPFLAIEIQKDDQNYKATILPYCTLAEKYGMYTHSYASNANVSQSGIVSVKSLIKAELYGYAPKYNENTKSYFAYSLINSVNSDENNANFYFGNKKYRGASAETENMIKNNLSPNVGTLTYKLQDIVASDVNRSDQSAQTASAAIGLAGALVQGALVLWATYAKTTEISFDLYMQRLFEGCSNLRLIQITHVTSTSSESETTDIKEMRLYKLYPEDKILFAANGNELFGYRTFTKDENQKTDEYKQLMELKNRGAFNKQTYKKLSDKITGYCFERAKEDPRFGDFANDCETRFGYATKGLSLQTFSNKYGTFKGWIDLSGKMNGMGKCTLNDGTTYVGSWDNNKYSGKGKITFGDKTTIYTGMFKNNKYDGNGMLYKDAISYKGEFANGAFEGTGVLIDAKGDKYDGAWKKDNPVKGTITYTNGDRYEGECAYNKKMQIIERNGQGTMAYANGETASGKWKNNELTSKK